MVGKQPRGMDIRSIELRSPVSIPVAAQNRITRSCALSFVVGFAMIYCLMVIGFLGAPSAAPYARAAVHHLGCPALGWLRAPQSSFLNPGSWMEERTGLRARTVTAHQVIGNQQATTAGHNLTAK